MPTFIISVIKSIGMEYEVIADDADEAQEIVEQALAGDEEAAEKIYEERITGDSDYGIESVKEK